MYYISLFYSTVDIRKKIFKNIKKENKLLLAGIQLDKIQVFFDISPSI